MRFLTLLLTASVLLTASDAALDKARGNWVRDMAHTDLGETPGTDYSKEVQGLLLRLVAEGRGRE